MFLKMPISLQGLKLDFYPLHWVLSSIVIDYYISGISRLPYVNFFSGLILDKLQWQLSKHENVVLTIIPDFITIIYTPSPLS